MKTARSIYLSVDPFRQYRRFSREWDLIIYECIFSSTFSIFLILLLVWTGLYSAFNIEETEKGLNHKNDKPDFCEKNKYKIIHSVRSL